MKSFQIIELTLLFTDMDAISVNNKSNQLLFCVKQRPQICLCSHHMSQFVLFLVSCSRVLHP